MSWPHERTWRFNDKLRDTSYNNKFIINARFYCKSTRDVLERLLLLPLQ